MLSGKGISANKTIEEVENLSPNYNLVLVEGLEDHEAFLGGCGMTPVKLQMHNFDPGSSF